MLAPITFIVTLVLILALFAGVVILLKALGGGNQRGRKQRGNRSAALDSGIRAECPDCGHTNPTHAAYCGRCGRPRK